MFLRHCITLRENPGALTPSPTQLLLLSRKHTFCLTEAFGINLWSQFMERFSLLSQWYMTSLNVTLNHASVHLYSNNNRNVFSKSVHGCPWQSQHMSMSQSGLDQSSHLCVCVCGRWREQFYSSFTTGDHWKAERQLITSGRGLPGGGGGLWWVSWGVKGFPGHSFSTSLL